ncbi:GNAT family N-acetyltransferase [Candidatus Uhrbacteria bacterium]|nr:GNAT family N-acetyltransferase [Candidatus Uhrbacteria bacterium]
MITKWVRRPAKGYTLTLRGVDGRPRATPIAFATLSQCEANLPTDTVEVGHLLVAPTHRHHGWGQHLVAALSRSALQRGFHRIVARVERSNVAGAALILQPSLRFREMDPAAVPWDPEQRTRWFERRQ